MNAVYKFWENIRDNGAFDTEFIWFAIDQNECIIALVASEFSPIDNLVFQSKEAYFKLVEYVGNLPVRGVYSEVPKRSKASLNCEEFDKLVSRGIDVYDWDFETLKYLLVLKSDAPLSRDLIDSIHSKNLPKLEITNNPMPHIINTSIDMRNFIKQKMVVKEDNRNWLEKKLNISRRKIRYEMVEDGIMEGSSFTR